MKIDIPEDFSVSVDNVTFSTVINVEIPELGPVEFTDLVCTYAWHT